jgi:hypothetical protein
MILSAYRFVFFCDGEVYGPQYDDYFHKSYFNLNQDFQSKEEALAEMENAIRAGVNYRKYDRVELVEVVVFG